MSYPMKYPPMERKPDGSLYRMTSKQHREAVRIINEQCCNCNDGNCLLLDDGEEVACPQMLSCSVCCTIFRNVLLKEPAGKKLEAEIFHKDNVHRCARCGKPFAATGNRAKYCADCKAIVQREQKAAYARRRRAESRKMEA